MTTLNFSDFGVDKSEIKFQENSRGDTQSFDIRRDVYPKLKNYSKSIVKYLSEDREVLEKAMISI